MNSIHKQVFHYDLMNPSNLSKQEPTLNFSLPSSAPNRVGFSISLGPLLRLCCLDKLFRDETLNCVPISCMMRHSYLLACVDVSITRWNCNWSVRGQEGGELTETKERVKVNHRGMTLVFLVNTRGFGNEGIFYAVALVGLVWFDISRISGGQPRLGLVE